jgi:hypothetical protein
MNIKPYALAVALLSATLAQATCFSVYKSDGTVLHQSSTTPVDLTQPIGDTIPAKFGPGASMTMSESGFYCRDSAAAAKGTSLADAVLAEEQKTMLVKGPAPKTEEAKVVVAEKDSSRTVLVKQDGTTAPVETTKGTVLRMKAKAKDKEKEAQ